MNKETHGWWATIWGRDAWTKDSPDESESFWIRDDEKGETGDEGSHKLVLLLSTVTTTTTIFKETHDYLLLYSHKKIDLKSSLLVDV